MSLPSMDKIAGYLLIATWASSKDGWKLKTLVTVALVVDTVSIVGEYICVYLYTITYVGDLEYLSKGHWPLPLYALTTGVLGAMVQGFLVVQYWRFTRNSLISLVLSLGIIIAFGSVFADCLMVVLYPSFEDRLKVKIPATLWLVTEVTVDVAITSALLWEFRKASSILTETKRCTIWQILYQLHGSGILSVLDRLTAVTIQSGAAAAALAAAGLIAFNVVPETNVAGGFLFLLGRVYVITLASVEDPRQPRSPGTLEHALQGAVVDSSRFPHIRGTERTSSVTQLHSPAVISLRPPRYSRQSNYASKKQ
ncbi:hypothetical protein DFH08DRAFT_1000430 [Mycena albidolilacea]|uniref:DUF6534 domain-containing protein n=1 Tax=Mycena albidolilacea TaxID=1033008 RepID=A0AAD7A401_9AGAR|nr:hypothetical protein DFH08DRAFT_1000430 [Mycena albidolilacea]